MSDGKGFTLWTRDDQGQRVPVVPLADVLRQLEAAGQARRDAMRELATLGRERAVQLVQMRRFDDGVPLTDAVVFREGKAAQAAGYLVTGGAGRGRHSLHPKVATAAVAELRGSSGAFVLLGELAEAEGGPSWIDTKHDLHGYAMTRSDVLALFPALAAPGDAKPAQVLQLVPHAGKATTSTVELTSARQGLAGRPWTGEQQAELLRQHEALQAIGRKNEAADREIASAWSINESTVKQQRLKAARERKAVPGKSKAGT